MPDWSLTSILTTVLIMIALYAFRPWLSAYTAEKGKRLATREDMEAILKELRHTTTEVENIKTEIARSEWNRKWILNQKREIYQGVFDVIGKLVLGHQKQLAAYLIRKAGARVAQPGFENQSHMECAELSQTLRTQQAIAAVFLSEESCRIIDEISSKRPLSGASTLDAEIEWSQSEIELLEKKCSELIQTAKRDLMGSSHQQPLARPLT